MTRYTYRYTDGCESFLLGNLDAGEIFDAPLTDEALERAILDECKDYDNRAMEITLNVYEQVWETLDPKDPGLEGDYWDDDWDYEINRINVTIPGLPVDHIDHVHVYEIRGHKTNYQWELVIAADMESVEKYASKRYARDSYYIHDTGDTGDTLPPHRYRHPVIDKDGSVIVQW